MTLLSDFKVYYLGLPYKVKLIDEVWIYTPKPIKPSLVLPKGTMLKVIGKHPFEPGTNFSVLETLDTGYNVLVRNLGIDFTYSTEVFNKTFEPIKQEVLFVNESMTTINCIKVYALNEFQGANIHNTQVLKSAAGYYIGSLCKADWCEEEFWEPYSRDSNCYWGKRKDAEEALINNNYPVKF